MDRDLGCCTAQELDRERRAFVEDQAKRSRESSTTFAGWAEGFGVIEHDALTQWRVGEMVSSLVAEGTLPDATTGYERLMAADRIASAGMWLVVHMTYARRAPLAGKRLEPADFKRDPEGHTGGSLNMVPAYAAYLTLNALDGVTRSWMMGQGHCVAAIDALNLIVGNMSPEHERRYALDDGGLSRFVSDFYGYGIGPDGLQATPVGSHVNAHTAGGVLEGGYLGFAELQYAHAPLPGERLVAFLSDGAFEEQRGSDWAPRWWRAQDCGLVSPIMILNGRRIEQRTQIAQQGGESWLHRHLRLNGFRPVGIDGRDPASIAWGIWQMEARQRDYKAGVPYGIAQTIKGFGFPGAGTNRAHNLPLSGNPSRDPVARTEFNEGAARLHVGEKELRNAVDRLATHEAQRRPRERDHPVANRHVDKPVIPAFVATVNGGSSSPMSAIDRHFSAIVTANPGMRPRVGNPDELRSNRLDRTLDLLKHRVSEVEAGIAESVTGGVITALNEEAVVCAALGNKGGINLVVTYEAFAPKMLGALRQEITFARQLRRAGRPAGWLGVPVVLTSHTWENAKNEISHQDPTLAEALLGEMADTVSVVFPPDANAAAACLEHVYLQRGRISAMVVPKRDVVDRLTWDQARLLAAQGALLLDGTPSNAEVLLVATGAYQLAVLERARLRLSDRSIRSALVYVSEPARLRMARDDLEMGHVLSDEAVFALFPPGVPRVFVTHTRPEPFLGALRRIDTGPASTEALGFINCGGTLDIDGLLFANKSTWAHALAAVARVLARDASELLTPQEMAAIGGAGDPNLLRRSGDLR